MQSPKNHAWIRQWSAIAASLALVFGFLVVARTVSARSAADDNQANQMISAVPSYQIPPGAQAEILLIEREIDQTERQTLQLLNTNLDSIHQIQTLGKLELFDKSLSVNKNEACSFCHMPETGYTGRSSVLNRTTVAYPGSVRTRFSQRKPQSYTYATLSPVLHYNSTQNDFYGGNFWDMRATGARLQNPSAEQAQGPPTNPVEMGLPDNACVAYRLSQGAYVSLFVKVWGAAIKSIEWPGDANRICSTPVGANGVGPQLNLSAEDRDRANTIYDQFGLSIAGYEGSPEVNAFSSKFDAYLAGLVNLSSQEMHGYELFNGVAHCNTCHLSGNASGATGGSVADAAPLFTDFTSSNLGLPRNPSIPYYYENKPDKYGYIANPVGVNYVDLGVGGFLSGQQGSPVPDQSWISLASQFDGKMQVPTLRNVDMRPYPGFVRAYMHNGYLKSLKEVVHFYNTRDTKCNSPNDPGVKTTCWPQPEVYENQDPTIGNLGLSSADEDDIVAFLKTLTDGYTTVSPLNVSNQSSRLRRMNIRH